MSTDRIRESNVTEDEYHEFMHILAHHNDKLTEHERETLQYCAGKAALGDVDGIATKGALISALAIARRFRIAYPGGAIPRENGAGHASLD